MLAGDDALVVDASALIAAFTDRGGLGQAARRRLHGSRRHAPHLVDAEVGNVLRRMALRGDISAEAARRSRMLATRAVGFRYRLWGPLADRAWELRDNVSFYDALYVALAESLDAPLVTVDARLAQAPGPRCVVEVVNQT